MIKLIDLNYYNHTNLANPADVLDLQKAAYGFVHFIKDRLSIQLVKHMNYEGEDVIEDIRYNFFKSSNSFWHIPFKTHRYIKSQQPDIVLSQGLIFPFRIIALRVMLGRKVKIIVQHHGEKPFGIKRIFQKIADRYIDAYFFTSNDNATEWIDKRIISSKSKCFEVLEGSTFFKLKNKLQCKEGLGMHKGTNFLWVGRLDDNKDPLTILRAFEKYVQANKEAKLYMAYQTNDLITEMKQLIEGSEALSNAVLLLGEITYAQLEYWYNAADFFILGSHSEGSGYALLEAMGCGCIPVVTSIPSFRKITGDGEYGILFEPGNAEDLYKKLLYTGSMNKEEYSKKVYDHAKQNLSHEAIAQQIYQHCLNLLSK